MESLAPQELQRFLGGEALGIPSAPGTLFRSLSKAAFEHEMMPRSEDSPCGIREHVEICILYQNTYYVEIA